MPYRPDRALMFTYMLPDGHSESSRPIAMGSDSEQPRRIIRLTLPYIHVPRPDVTARFVVLRLLPANKIVPAK